MFPRLLEGSSILIDLEVGVDLIALVKDPNIIFDGENFMRFQAVKFWNGWRDVGDVGREGRETGGSPCVFLSQTWRAIYRFEGMLWWISWWRKKHLFSSGFLSSFFLNCGEMIQLDEHVFHMGWFNHELETYGNLKGSLSPPEIVDYKSLRSNPY